MRLRAENWAKSSDVDIIWARHFEVNGFLLENVDLISTLIPQQNKTSPLSYHNCAVKFFFEGKTLSICFWCMAWTATKNRQLRLVLLCTLLTSSSTSFAHYLLWWKTVQLRMAKSNFLFAHSGKFHSKDDESNLWRCNLKRWEEADLCKVFSKALFWG